MKKKQTRQAKYDAVQRARGFKQVRLWVPAADRDELRKIAADMCDKRAAT